MTAQTKDPSRFVTSTMSEQAASVYRAMPDSPSVPFPAADDLATWEKLYQAMEGFRTPQTEEFIASFNVKTEVFDVAGVPVQQVRPAQVKDEGKRILYVHGGAYTFYSAHSTLVNAVQVAAKAGAIVWSVDYTVAPRAKWQKIVGEVADVFTAAIETYGAGKVAGFGDSAGGGLIAGAVLQLRDEGKAVPAALGLLSPWSDITDEGDSYTTLKDAEPTYSYDLHLKPCADAYADPSDQKHPYASPVYGTYGPDFPPTIIQGGTREIFLSHCVRQYQVIDQAGGTAVLDLYEAMPHVFQAVMAHVGAPESEVAIDKLVRFFDRHMS